MKKIIYIIIAVMIALIVFLLAQEADANSSHTYNVVHNVEVHMNGDFNFNSNITTPSQGDVEVSLEGVGEAYLKSELEIYEVTNVSRNWFDIF